MINLKRCTNCLLPETHETIVFDEEGVCNVCRQHEYKHTIIDWETKKRDLDELIATYRGKYDYDCIIPFSGGKDSTWILYYLVKEYGIKPLVVRFDHGFLRPNVLENTIRSIRQLGVDLHVFTPNWKVVQQLMLQSFLEKGDFCWHCHTGIYAYPMWVAIRYQVPLVFWGESSPEYTGYYSWDQPEEVDEKRFNRLVNLGVTARDMLIRLEGRVDERNLTVFGYPPLKELRKLNYRSVCLGSYIPWDVKKHYSIIRKELEWKGDEVEGVPPGYEYEKIECYLQGVRDYIKLIKRGFARTTWLTSIDVWNHRIDRKTAMKLVEEYEGKRPPSLDLFLEYVGLSEEIFLEIAMSHQVSPYQHDPTQIQTGKQLHDFNQWIRHPAMDPQVVQNQLDRWYRRNEIFHQAAVG